MLPMFRMLFRSSQEKIGRCDDIKSIYVSICFTPMDVTTEVCKSILLYCNEHVYLYLSAAGDTNALNLRGRLADCGGGFMAFIDDNYIFGGLPSH